MTQAPQPEISRSWLHDLEDRIGCLPFLHPYVVSAIKLLGVVPLLGLALRPVATLPAWPGLVLPLFALFAILDWMEGIGRGRLVQESRLGRVTDRLATGAVLAALALPSWDLLAGGLVVARLGLEAVLILLAAMGRDQTRGRVRTALGYTTLLALLFLIQGWAHRLVSPDFVEALLWVGIVHAAIVALHDVGILQKRLLADALSTGNLLCGVFSMIFASRGRVDVSLLFLLIGAAFDGFDGAAARRYGSTPWGVYSDDVADAVNYGLAPGVALFFALRSWEGVVVGCFYSVFTIGRLVFFTLNKANSDPNFFSGVPSTAGAISTLAALLLFPNHPVMVGLIVGIAGIWMVSFDTPYRHLGRALAGPRRVIYGMPFVLLFLVAGLFLWGETVPVSILLGATLIYGFGPVVGHFRGVLGPRGRGSGGSGSPRLC